jgi:uncharacterized protein YndB with AHSA1/START domain
VTAEVSRSRTVGRPAERVWDVLADFAAIARWAPNVDHSSLLRAGDDEPASGVGLVRRVQVGRTTLLEQVVEWDEPTTLAYDIRGLPAVVVWAGNRWRVDPAGEQAGVVTLTSGADCGPRPPQLLIARVVARRLAKDSATMLAGLGRALEGAPHV